MSNLGSEIVVFVGMGACFASVVVFVAYVAARIEDKAKGGSIGKWAALVMRLAVYSVALCAIFGNALMLRQMYHGEVPDAGLLIPVSTAALTYLAWWLRPSSMRR